MNLTKEQVIEEIKRGESLQNFPEWCDDKEVVLEAVKQNGWGWWSLGYASKRLRDDKEVVLEAVRVHSWNLGYASERLKDDKDVVLEAIKKDVWNMRHASQEIKDKIGGNNSVLFLEQWIKSEKQQKKLEQQLDKKESVGKIKI